MDSIVRCHAIDEHVEAIVASLRMHDCRIAGIENGARTAIAIGDIIYLESIDARTFAYTRDAVIQVSMRLACFGLCLYVLLAAMGACFNWFPADNMGAWISFTAIYVVILVLMTIVFNRIYRRGKRELNEGLERYKSQSK